MDTIKILLCAVVALLLGALVMSWNNFQHEERNAPPAELAKVRQQIEEIRTEQGRLRLERERILYGLPSKPASAAKEEPAAEAQEAVATLEEGTGPPPSLGMPPAEGAEAEAPPQLPPGKSAEERAKIIQAAAVVAKVTEWVEDKEIGAFATVEIILPDQVKTGTVLCLRRNSGILGRLQIGDVSPEGAIANSVSQFEGIKPKAGDELILEPAP